MINRDIRYYSDEMIKNELRNLEIIIFERMNTEKTYIEHIKKLFLDKICNEKDETRKNELIMKMDRYNKRNFGKVRSVLDYYDMRINAICNHLDKADNDDLNFVYDMLIYPIGIKELVKKYKVKDMNHCYRKLDKIVALMNGKKS